MPEMSPPQLDLSLLTRRAISQHAELIAVEDIAGRRLSFREVGARSNRLGNALGEMARPGDRVGILVPRNRIEFVEIDLAIIKAGLTKVPINPRLAEDEREFIASHAQPTVLFADETTAEHALDDRQERRIGSGGDRSGRATRRGALIRRDAGQRLASLRTFLVSRRCTSARSCTRLERRDGRREPP